MRVNNQNNVDLYVNKDLRRNENSKENIKKNLSMQKDEYITNNTQEKKLTYTKPEVKVDHQTIERLKAESERAYSHLKEMVRQMLEKQGMTFKDIEDIENVKVDEETRLKAKSLIGEGGNLSPEKVSDRIVEFAEAISGGNKNKLEELKSSIREGFRQAAGALGGELPEISQKTYDMIMEKLDKWAQE